MAVDAGEEQRGRGPGQPFKPGQSGDPKGRRTGTLNRVPVLAQRLMDSDTEAVILALLCSPSAVPPGLAGNRECDVPTRSATARPA